jgi:hypothetical protein
MANTKWITPFEDLKIANLVARDDTIVVAGSTHDAGFEVRSARWYGDRFGDFRRIDVPYPKDAGPLWPTLSLDRHAGRLALAIDLGDEQIDSRGLYVFPDLASTTRERVPKNPDDPEGDFAESLVLRGDTLLTRSAWELRCFHRERGRWTQRMALRAGDDSDIEWSPPIDLSPSGAIWMTGRSSVPARLVLLERRNETFVPAFELAMDDAPMSIVFLGDDEALVGSGAPWRDGASLRTARAQWMGLGAHVRCSVRTRRARGCRCRGARRTRRDRAAARRVAHRSRRRDLRPGATPAGGPWRPARPAGLHHGHARGSPRRKPTSPSRSRGLSVAALRCLVPDGAFESRIASQ